MVVDSTIRNASPERDSVRISAASAFNICDGLFRMANCFVTELPEAELRDVRYVLNTLLTKVDRLLHPTEEYDLSLNFGGLTVDANVCRYPGGEDFGAGKASTSTGAGRSTATSPPRYRRNTFQTSTPVPALASVPDPDPTPILIPRHGNFPLILSTRNNVGFPDYTHHPLFVRPGIPGAYQRPPTASGLTEHTGFYYIVCKGLYVGIFTDWDEVSPWVIGISGSIHRKTKNWEEARDLYNARLSTGVVQILP